MGKNISGRKEADRKHTKYKLQPLHNMHISTVNVYRAILFGPYK